MPDISPNIDQELLQAYIRSDYRLLRTNISIKINQLNPHLDSFLIDNNGYSWVFISAENPQSFRLSKAKNQKRYEQLLEIAKVNDYRYWEGLGEGNTKEWPAESSLLILDLPKEEILALARRFDQKAVVIGQLNQKSELLFV